MKQVSMKKRIALLLVLMMTSVAAGCAESREKQRAETITVYLWSNVLYESYAPYVQSRLPDVNIQFIVGQNDLEFYRFINENGKLPDIIMSRRFSRHDALPMKEQLMDLSSTDEAGALYDAYIRDFTNNDGTVNWLPVCGIGDGILANKALFEAHGIPLPTDYDSFISAIQAFEALGIRGFNGDFVYDYTCMEILQGFSIPEITSAEGSKWRSCYEDPDDEETGLDDTVWPDVFENMEQLIKDAGIGPEDVWMDCEPLADAFRNEQVAMIRACSNDVALFNEEGVKAVFLPYFGKNGEQWILTYPEFQVALSKELEQDESRRGKALQVLSVMLSEEAQKVLSNHEDVISYYQNVKVELSPYLDNLKPIIRRNHMYIRVASNQFFSVSKEVVTRMIEGEYDAKQAYKAFDDMLRKPAGNPEEVILSSEKGYSNNVYTEGGSESYSVMANTIRGIYGSDVLICPGFSFTGSVLATEYTEKQVSSLIMPNGLAAYHGEMTGRQLKECIRDYVEGAEGGFIPFNRGSLPVVSGASIRVREQSGDYTLLDVKKDGKEIRDEDTYRVTCLNSEQYMLPFLAKETPVLERGEQLVKADLVEYIRNGGTLAEPENYITVKVER